MQLAVDFKLSAEVSLVSSDNTNEMPFHLDYQVQHAPK